MQAPIAKKVSHQKKIHGTTISDDYNWMRYIDEDPDVKKLLDAENAYTEYEMQDVKDFREKLFQELKSRHLETYTTSTYPHGKYLYYSRFEKGKEYAIHCRKKDANASEEIVLDENEIAKEFEYFDLGAFSLSPNHNLLAYSYDVDGSEKYTIKIKDLTTGELLPDTINETTYGVEWYADNSTFIYVRLDDQLRPYQVKSHQLQSSLDQSGNNKNAEDKLLLEDTSGEYFLSIHQDLEGRFLYIGAYGSIDNSVYFTSAHDKSSEVKLISKRKEKVEYYVDQQDSVFYIRTNDKHHNFRIVKVSSDDPSAGNWKEVIPANDDRSIISLACFKEFIAYQFRENGLETIELHLNSGEVKKIPFPAKAYQASFGSNYNYECQTFRFNYSALNQPSSAYDFHLVSEKREQVYIKEVPNFDPENYVVERVFATAQDGSKIPISLVTKKDFQKNAEAPAFLYGYGSYGACIPPSFVDRIFTFVDRGFCFALAHIRGSSTMGENWHLDGKFLKKKNTFSDFKDCAQFLIDEKYTSKGNISISGGSAGGLLMGATINLAPELFKSVVAAVPFVDVLNTMLDSSLPLTKLEYKEWGNPEADEEYFHYIKSYSPYDNIEKKNYPHILCTGGLNDPRVTYWEPTKFIAKLRENKTNNTLSLLKINMGGGHFGASGRFEYLKEYALEYAFILKCHGITS